jgi:uncharacterized membrane protein
MNIDKRNLLITMLVTILFIQVAEILGYFTTIAIYLLIILVILKNN